MLGRFKNGFEAACAHMHVLQPVLKLFAPLAVICMYYNPLWSAEKLAGQLMIGASWIENRLVVNNWALK